MEIPITQSAAWKQLQDDLKVKSHITKGNGYHYLAIVKSTPVGNYLYLPYGPIYDTREGLHKALSTLQQLSKQHKAIFARIEPRHPDFLDDLSSDTIKRIHKTTDQSPAETWVLDLTGKDADFRTRLPSRLLRYYKSSHNKGITIETSHNPDDIHYLLTLQKSLATKKGISTFSEDYLKTELSQPFATLYLVRYEGQVISAGLVFDDGDTRYNLQGAQDDQGRKLHATGILTIQLILDAREKGLKLFDFWGIAPEGAPPTHPWAGFTAFKKTFAGREVTYAGTYDLVYNPIKYRIYQLTRKVNRIIHGRI